MRCPLCAHEVKADQKFCQECGASLGGVTEANTSVKIVPTKDAPAGLVDTDSVATTSSDTELVDSEVVDSEVVDSEVADPSNLPTGEIDSNSAPAEMQLPNVADLPTREIKLNTAGRGIDTPDFDEVTDMADLPTREINIREEIPDPDWATPTSDVPVAAASVAVPPLEPFDPPAADETTAMATGDVSSTTQIPVHVHEAAAAQQFDVGGATGPGTDEIPAVFDGSNDVYEYPEPRPRFTFKLVFVFAFFGAIAVLLCAIADVIDIRTSAPVDGIATGIRTLDTLGTNLAVAGFVGAMVMVLGGLLACFGFRWGAGLAGGAGLAMIGWSAIVVALAELRIADAQSKTQVSDFVFTLTVRRDLGFWLVVAVAALGLLVFVTSLRSIGTGGRPALNPWIAALGAVAGVVLIAGPMLPEGNATFNNNFRSASQVLDLPTAYFAGRLIQLALIGVSVVFGMLIVRAYGLGLAAGGISVALWMWVTSLIDLGQFPLGIAAGNFGSGDTGPHAVTTVGMAATVFMLVVAAILAAAGNQRRRRI